MGQKLYAKIIYQMGNYGVCWLFLCPISEKALTYKKYIFPIVS